MRPRTIVADAEAVALIAVRDRQMLPWLAWLKQHDARLYITGATLAEVTDGTSRDVAVRRVVASATIVPTDEAIGFQAGKLRAEAAGVRKKPRDLTVDAIVAATARSLPSPAVVITGDPDDFNLLLQGSTVRVERI